MTRPAPGWIEELPTNRLLIEVSLWSADLTRLADDLARVEPYADILHIDVADGHFAPALLFFPDLLARVREQSSLPIHVHLMVTDDILLSQIEQFAEAGADAISIHAENRSTATDALDRIDSLGAAPGMVLCVETPVAEIAPHLKRLRFLTLLGTAIGVKGKGIDPTATARLREARALIAASAAPRRTILAADGGIREHTVPVLRAAGTETIVAGSLVFQADSLADRIRWLHTLPR
jgi:ribulose-phosphate 3-epimerase